MNTKYVLVVLALLLITGVAAAETVSINVTAKQLVIDDGKFYGILVTNNTTVNTFVTGEAGSLGKTLNLLNQIKIGVNNLTVSNGVISSFIS